MIAVSRKVRLFGIDIDAIDMRAAVDQLLLWMENPLPRCRYVVTPNVDHAVIFQENEGLREAYREASLVLADGAPVVWVSKLLNRPLPGRVTGSDLVPALFTASVARKPLRVFLLGAAPGVAERAARAIESRWGTVSIVGTYSPPIGFERDETENDKIVSLVNESRPDCLILGLGAPKQELWIHKTKGRLKAPVALCVGATIDFLAGEKPRAPRWMRTVGAEWVFRVASEPNRLFKRYARDAWIFPQLVFRQWRGDW